MWIRNHGRDGCRCESQSIRGLKVGHRAAHSFQRRAVRRRGLAGWKPKTSGPREHAGMRQSGCREVRPSAACRRTGNRQARPTEDQPSDPAWPTCCHRRGPEQVEVDRWCEPALPQGEALRRLVLGSSLPDTHGERSVQELGRFIAAPAPCSTGTAGRNRRCVACDAQSDRADVKGYIEAA